MKINARLVRALREDRSWSQGALARAAGLNLRTVQRIENEAAASSNSVQALAAALGIDARDLEPDSTGEAVRYEFRLVEIEPSESLSGIRPDLADLLQAAGDDGWMLVQILPPDLAQRLQAGRTGRFVAVLQRSRPPRDDEARSARTRR